MEEKRFTHVCKTATEGCHGGQGRQGRSFFEGRVKNFLREIRAIRGRPLSIKNQ